MSNFVEKTLDDVQRIFVDLFYSETGMKKTGFIQKLDPRVKLVSFVTFVIITGFTVRISLLMLLLFYLIILVCLAEIPVKSYLLRVGGFSMVFTGIVLLPALFNIVKTGTPLVYVTDSFYITREGAFNALLLILRSFVSLSFFYIFTSTTNWLDVLRALRALKVPVLFVAILEMTQRYIFLLLNLVSNMFLAKKSRTFRKAKGSEGRAFVANTMGNLLIKSNALSIEVYNAMVSRGYNGEIRTLNRFRVKKADYIWIGSNLVFVAIICLIRWD